MKLYESLKSAYTTFATSVVPSVQDVLLFCVRLHWGWAFFLTGRGKFVNFERTTQFFESLGIPYPALNVIMAASTELLGGILLLLGLGSRIAAVPLIGTMLVALLTAHSEELSSLLAYPDIDPFLKAEPFLFLFASLLVFAFGPGRISLDHLISKRLKRS